jgi:hypothetical protein
MKQQLIALLFPVVLLAADESPSPSTAVFGGAIVSSDAAGVSKLKSQPRDLHILPSDAELKRLVTGTWKNHTAELQLMADGKLIFTEKHPGLFETISGTWEIKAGKILYSIDPKNPSAQRETYQHTILQAHASALQLQCPSGLAFDFIKAPTH